VPRGAILAIALALAAAAQTRPGAATEQELSRNAAKNPASAEAHYALGSFYFQTGRPDRAVLSLERATELAPSRAAYWKALGAAYAAQSRFELAEAPLRKACELDPRLEGACYYLGRNLYAENQFEPALAAFEKALKFGPPAQRWLVQRGLGLALEALGRSGEASKAFRAAVESAPPSLRADEDPRVDYAIFLMRQGRLDQALTPLQDHVKRFPASARGRFELGRVLSQKDEMEAAAKHLEEAVKADPQYWAAHLLLGRVYMRLGRNADGERHLALGEKGAATSEHVR
jgi:Flp pilus assembly protein TadD